MPPIKSADEAVGVPLAHTNMCTHYTIIIHVDRCLEDIIPESFEIILTITGCLSMLTKYLGLKDVDVRAAAYKSAAYKRFLWW